MCMSACYKLLYDLLVTAMDAKFMDRYVQFAGKLRSAGINTEVYLEGAKLGNQLSYADRKGFRLAIIAGENEFAKEVVQIKNLSNKTARDVASGDLVSAVQSMLRG